MLNLLPRQNRKEGIDLADYCHAADALSVPVSRVRAVDAVESAGSGFLASGRPKILFEGHLFHKFTGGKFSKNYPTISYPTWTTAHYKGGEAEYKRLEMAFKLDPKAALRAASWGRFQILGDNFKLCGFANVEDFVEAMFADEDNHLEAFVTYVMRRSLADELQRGDFNGFAYAYNGSQYKRNKYAEKLSNADHKFAAIKIDCRALAATPPRVEAVLPADCRPSGCFLGNTSLDDRYLSPAFASLAQSEPTVSVTQPGTPDPSPVSDAQPNSPSNPPTTTEGDVVQQPTSTASLSGSLDTYVGKASQVQDKIDAVNGVISRINGSTKSLITFVVSKIIQIVLFISAFVAGVPMKYWAVMAVILGSLTVAYIYRQTVLDKIREMSKSTAGS